MDYLNTSTTQSMRRARAVAHNQHKWLDLVTVLVWC